MGVAIGDAGALVAIVRTHADHVRLRTRSNLLSKRAFALPGSIRPATIANAMGLMP